jgi:DNA-binding LacI/PurR family transcriptional regulator
MSAESGRRSAQPTMRDIAEAAGVSKALVSIVFRDVPGASAETRAHVLEVAERIGYRPNRSASMLARRRNRLLGVSASVRNPFHAELVEDLQAVVDEAGYELVLSARTRTHDESRSVETLLEFRCEALILLGSDIEREELARLGRSRPVIVLGRHDVPEVDTVRTADDRGLELVVDHLALLGHRRIVHVDGGVGPIADDRRAGYRSAMTRLGLGTEIDVVRGGATESDGQRVATELASRSLLPTAVAAFNDQVAVGLLDGFGRAGFDVPRRMSVTGYDDSPVAALVRVDLTTVNQQSAAQARWAVDAAVERLDQGRTEARQTALMPRLVMRGSTFRPEHG